jgi:hypothetical protein
MADPTCTCTIEGGQINFCQLHRAASEMLSALENLVSAHDEQPPMLTQAEWDAARAAIATAGGRLPEPLPEDFYDQ